jgi:hypothetical protein
VTRVMALSTICCAAWRTSLDRGGEGVAESYREYPGRLEVQDGATALRLTDGPVRGSFAFVRAIHRNHNAAIGSGSSKFCSSIDDAEPPLSD